MNSKPNDNNIQIVRGITQIMEDLRKKFYPLAGAGLAITSAAGSDMSTLRKFL